MQHEKLKTYIEQHMTSCKVPDEYQAAKSAVAEAGPKGDEDRVVSGSVCIKLWSGFLTQDCEQRVCTLASGMDAP